MTVLAMGYLVVWRLTPESRAPAPQTMARAAQPSGAPSVFHLEKLPTRLPAGGLLWRGTPTDDRRAELQDLARALDPYEQDDFAEAARRLGAFTARRPQNAMAHLYLGISELFLGRHQEAVVALTSAQRLPSDDPELSSHAAWYLAMAHQRLGQRDRARALLDSLCQGATIRSALGCAASLELSKSSDSQPR
jgi:tetratricopeptide (TPR) repeat protein